MSGEVSGKWCGQEQPHAPHTWSTMHGFGFYTTCYGYSAPVLAAGYVRESDLREAIATEIHALRDEEPMRWLLGEPNPYYLHAAAIALGGKP